MKKWSKPTADVEYFGANDSVTACWGVSCAVDKANEVETSWYFPQDIYAIQIYHRADHCGNSSNQVIFDDDNDNVGDRMVETHTDGHGTLACTLYTNDQYTQQRSVRDVKVGDYIYWTTAAGTKVWHHQGQVFPTAEGHPNRS